MKKYKLKVDVLWYKTGTIFELNGDKVYITQLDRERMLTFDSLQLAIAEHLEDDGSEDYFELLTDK